MSELSELIRNVMLFMFDKGLDATSATQEICAVYIEALTPSTCRRWFQKFRNGDRSLKDLSRNGRPSFFDEDHLIKLLNENKHATIRELAFEMNCSPKAVFTHLHKLGFVS